MPHLSRVVTFICLASLVGCGGGDAFTASPVGGAPVAVPRVSDDEVLNSLNALGVPLADEDSPRVASDGTVLADSWAPLGQTVILSKPSEYFCADLALIAGGADADKPSAVFQYNPEGTDGVPEVEVLGVPDLQPWLASSASEAIGADVDDDGFEELVIAYVESDVGADPAPDLRVVIFDDQAEAFALAGDLRFDTRTESPVTGIDLAVCDLELDGFREILVAVSFEAGPARLFFVSRVSGALVLLTSHGRAFPAPDAQTSVTAFIDAGNADNDFEPEIGVALTYRVADALEGKAEYRVLDMADGAYRVIAEGPIEHVPESGPTLDSITMANVVLADMDADRDAEILFAGLSPKVDPGAGTLEGYWHVLVGLDLAPQAPVVTQISSLSRNNGFQPSQGGTVRRIEHIYFESLDFDADGRDELLVNQVVYDNFTDVVDAARAAHEESENPAPFDPDSVPRWKELHIFTEDLFFPPQADAFTRRNTGLAVGDVDGREYLDADGQAFHRDEVLWVIQPHAEEIYIFDIDGTLDTIPLQPDPLSRTNPQEFNMLLVPVNVVDDSIIADIDLISRILIYGSPIVLAALAAPPCHKDAVQQRDNGCITSYGRTVSQSFEHEHTASARAKAMFGVGAAGAGGEFKNVLGFEVRLSKTWGVTSTREKSVVFEAGPMEDTVIFSAVPYDSYFYTFKRHTDPGRLGKRMQMLMPREPVVLMVQREFYNRVTPPDALKIEANVFQHTVGNVRSYPTRAQKDAIRAQFDIESRGWWENGLQHVGQVNGVVELGIAIGDERSSGFGVGISFEWLHTLSAGYAHEFELGIGYDADFTWTIGKEMVYTGSIGSLGADDFLNENLRYAFGMFVYYQEVPSGQGFEVINYWVE